MGKPYCQECNQHTEVAELREQLADARRMVTIAFDPDEYEQGRAAVAEVATAHAAGFREGAARVAELERLAAMLVSAVKCGEEWTDTLEQEYRRALAPAPAKDGEGP